MSKIESATALTYNAERNSHSGWLMHSRLSLASSMIYVYEYFSLLQSSLVNNIIFLSVISLVSTFLQSLLFFCSRLTIIPCLCPMEYFHYHPPPAPNIFLNVLISCSYDPLLDLFEQTVLGKFLFYCNLSFY